MPLFVAHHQHPPEACPVAREFASELLAHLSAANAARFGVAIQAEAVIDAEHRLLLIVEAPDPEHVNRFMAFFVRWGNVQVFPASSAEEAIARGSCVAKRR